MRVIIWADMEGTAGISVWEQVLFDRNRYQESRLFMTEEVNAAVRGAKKAGADEIIVVDSHGAGQEYSFRSLVFDKLEPGAEYVSGTKWLRYTEPLIAGCDAAICTGAHAMSGTPDGTLCHTVTTKWLNALINDRRAGEIAITAGVCGHFDCPVVFVSGDDATCREAKDFLGEEVTTVAVKKGINRFSCRSLTLTDACRKIEDGVASALKNPGKVKPYKPASPTTFAVEYISPECATEYAARPGVELVNERKTESKADSFYEAWDQFWTPA